MRKIINKTIGILFTKRFWLYTGISVVIQFMLIKLVSIMGNEEYFEMATLIAPLLFNEIWDTHIKLQGEKKEKEIEQKSNLKKHLILIIYISSILISRIISIDDFESLMNTTTLVIINLFLLIALTFYYEYLYKKYFK